MFVKNDPPTKPTTFSVDIPYSTLVADFAAFAASAPHLRILDSTTSYHWDLHRVRHHRVLHTSLLSSYQRLIEC